jgi:hypothetical protein
MTSKSGFIAFFLAFSLIGFASIAGTQEIMRVDDPTGAVESEARIPLLPAEEGITAGQRANVQERIALATAILDRLAPEAESTGLEDGWRQPRLESLLELPLSGLRAVQSSSSLAGLSEAVNTQMIEPQAIGDPAADLVYTPVTPCRYIDTRFVGGKISGTRGYDLASNGSIYGGSAACAPQTIFGASESQIAAVAMNVTVVDTVAAPGFAAIKPTATSPVSALVNWYQVGASVQVANQGIVTTDQTTASEEFFIQTSSAVHVIVDLFGAFVAPRATALECVSTAAAVEIVDAGANFNISPPTCPAGYAVVSVGCRAESWNSANWAITSFYGGSPMCSGTNITGFALVYEAYGRCCRIPGR